MKRVLSITLLGIYLALNLGLVMNTHYCCGKISSVSLFDTQATTCDLCGQQEVSTTCCEDTQTFLSIDDDQLKNKNTVPPFTDFFVTILPSYYTPSTSPYTLTHPSGSFYTFETGPPKTPLYLQIQSLRI